MTDERFDALLKKALMEANILQYQLVWEETEPPFSPGYLRWRKRLLTDPFRRGRPVWKRTLQSAACFLLAAVLMLGVAAAINTDFRETVRSVIEALFPPREITVMPEGLPEASLHTAEGREPKEESPGFAIYVDEERYELTEESGAVYIRPRSAGQSGDGLPVREMEIRELPDLSPAHAAVAARAVMLDRWETVTEMASEGRGLHFAASAGSTWDSSQEQHYFYGNGAEGTFHITIRYFLEASEGHGARFRAMLETFEVLPAKK